MRGVMSCLMVVVVLVAFGPAASAQELSEEEMVSMLETVDARQRAAGDYKALVLIDQKQKGKAELVYEAVIYRRDVQGKLLILFLKPKSEAGKGYLRLEKNLFMYDPSVGKWERRTDRENIGGTNSQRRDFDAMSFAKDYAPTYVAEEKLGKFGVHHIQLDQKEGREVAYPKMHVWVDKASGNVLKVQEYASSGKLMRTSYYPKWSKIKRDGEGDALYFPKEIRIFDEVEKGNSTTIVMQKVDLKKLDDNIFTKAWLESKSR